MLAFQLLDLLKLQGSPGLESSALTSKGTPEEQNLKFGKPCSSKKLPSQQDKFHLLTKVSLIKIYLLASKYLVFKYHLQ